MVQKMQWALLSLTTPMPCNSSMFLSMLLTRRRLAAVSTICRQKIAAKINGVNWALPPIIFEIACGNSTHTKALKCVTSQGFYFSHDCHANQISLKSVCNAF